MSKKRERSADEIRDAYLLVDTLHRINAHRINNAHLGGLTRISIEKISDTLTRIATVQSTEDD